MAIMNGDDRKNLFNMQSYIMNQWYSQIIHKDYVLELKRKKTIKNNNSINSYI